MILMGPNVSLYVFRAFSARSKAVSASGAVTAPAKLCVLPRDKLSLWRKKMGIEEEMRIEEQKGNNRRINT